MAAGNPPEYNSSVREFDIVTLDRVKKITVDVDYQAWKEYAYEVGIHGAIISYLDIKKENFYDIETTVDGKEIVTARGWEDLSRLMSVYEKLDIPIDESVILQYIQNRRIAKDFANYLDLYKKYQTDYNVDAVLAGKISESGVEKIKEASFDEKLSVINLMVSKLTSVFSDAYAKDLYVHDLFDVLKEIKEKFAKAQPSGSETAHILSDKILQIEEDLDLNAERGLYEENQVRSLKQVVMTLEGYRQNLIKKDQLEPEKAFRYIRASFSDDTTKRKQLIDKGKTNLENAFTFLEQAFGESQEMVIFITELNANRHCARFIRDNGSEKYDRYNQALLFNEKKEALLKDIDEVSDLADML